MEIIRKIVKMLKDNKYWILTIMFLMIVSVVAYRIYINDRMLSAEEKEKLKHLKIVKVQQEAHEQKMAGKFTRTYQNNLENDILKDLNNCSKVNYNIQIQVLNPLLETTTDVTHILEEIDNDGTCILYIILKDKVVK